MYYYVTYVISNEFVDCDFTDFAVAHEFCLEMLRDGIECSMMCGLDGEHFINYAVEARTEMPSVHAYVVTTLYDGVLKHVGFDSYEHAHSYLLDWWGFYAVLTCLDGYAETTESTYYMPMEPMDGYTACLPYKVRYWGPDCFKQHVPCANEQDARAVWSDLDSRNIAAWVWDNTADSGYGLDILMPNGIRCHKGKDVLFVDGTWYDLPTRAQWRRAFSRHGRGWDTIIRVILPETCRKVSIVPTVQNAEGWYVAGCGYAWRDRCGRKYANNNKWGTRTYSPATLELRVSKNFLSVIQDFLAEYFSEKKA